MNTTDRCIVVIEATFNPNGINTHEFKEYSKQSELNGEKNGGVVLSKYQILENLGQGDVPHMVMIIEYPSQAAAIQTFTGKEYQAILPLREVAFKKVKIYITKKQ